MLLYPTPLNTQLIQDIIISILSRAIILVSVISVVVSYLTKVENTDAIAADSVCVLNV